MFSRLREHFGTAGLVVAIVALIAALAGGAIAATGGSNGGKATASAKGKQGPRGKTGKTGPAGPAGPAGPQGAAGPKGDTGAPGTNGTNGVTGATGPTGNEGKAGKAGKDGETGFTEFLPSGMTETGVWRFESRGKTELKKTGEEYELVTPTEVEQFVPISFPIPLSVADAESIVVKTLNQVATPTTECPGTPEEPQAKPGFLCIYTSGFGSNFNGAPQAAYKPLSSGEEEGVISSGTLLYFEAINPGKIFSGSFAVTAP